MISVTSVTDKYILQPTLINKHKKTLGWLSASLLWKREIHFFQKLLDQYVVNFTAIEDKKKVDHFQSIITYYEGELIDSLMAKLRLHEKKLAEMLQSGEETRIEYFKEHDSLMAELESLNEQIVQCKEELYSFIEKVM
ncbi:hypothetical protein [Chryseosolibacter indicus]|uniref:Uncharacterized protein n=1 Tax=Chryseosolibacter indicus TaxID=2782351 RepID=A0ABS5VTL0_9BACT|nr:hypothetical protein [Chryseosolibacter indicus]MBT1704748.1 hypothetical protein [Chryseosolibacter indicus]